jgi:hypothetical protein
VAELVVGGVTTVVRLVLVGLDVAGDVVFVVVLVVVVLVVVVVVVVFDVVLVVVSFGVVVGFVVVVSFVVVAALVVAFAVVCFVVPARATALGAPPAGATCRTAATGATAEVVGGVVGGVLEIADVRPDPPPRASAVAGPMAVSCVDDCSDSANVTGFGEFETICTAITPAAATTTAAPIPARNGGRSKNGRGIRCLPV